MPVVTDALKAVFSARDAWHRELDSERGDEGTLHFSDLTGCPREVYLRLLGEPTLPGPRFIIGHAAEQYIAAKIDAEMPDDVTVRRGRVIEWNGLTGHLDIEILDVNAEPNTVLMVIDPTTTTRKNCGPNEGHTLKTAAYAYAVGAPDFAEWVLRLGREGRRIDILQDELHPFRTEDFVPTILERREMLREVEKAIAGEAPPPPEEPPEWVTWKCKEYCSAATCSKNGRQ
jgi:hypothetical protein